MVRRPVAWVVAVVLLVEALAVVLVNWFLGDMVDRQHMSLADLDPGAMSLTSKIAGLVIGLYLVLCCVVALRAALRDWSPTGAGRVLLVSVAVVHGFLAAVSLALVSLRAFVVMLVVLGLVVLLLMTYDHPEDSDCPAAAGDGVGGGDGAGGGDERGDGGHEPGDGGDERVGDGAPAGGVTPPAAPTGP